MSAPLHILLLEDSPTDAELIERTLRKNGLDFVLKCVQLESTFINALSEFVPDIVLSDYNLPSYSGKAALKVMQRDYPEIPLIVVTGALSDNEAVDLLESGAQDYVLKDRLARLAPAVRHALVVKQWNNSKRIADEEIKYLAFYDSLTGLPNRRLLLDRLNQSLAFCARSGRKGALLFIDLDNFKTLNDTLGHDIGDMLLQQVALRLESCVREGDTVSRLGGDEFVIMLEDLSAQSIDSAAQTEVIANKILAALNQPYQLGTHEYRNSPSIGATLFNDKLQTTDVLMKQADIAMYQAKKAGRNNLRFFDPKMQESINARATIESGLYNALKNREFKLYYQIQVHGIQSDGFYKPVGAEALIRWMHPERGMVSPMEFIPLAEETGLILLIGQWVLETACAQIKAWQENALTRDLVLAVNVSSKQFRQTDFVAQINSLIQRYEISPANLKLELTESLLLDNIEDTISKMSTLNKMGIHFSLDDFGTGYSSLQYLKRLPLDQLKIDRSFVRDIAIDPNDRAIVRTIIAMAKSLDMNVIAEGVETDEQLALLLQKGCLHYQGYLFGKPVPIEEFEEVLKGKVA